jgi:hypothetical protein
VEETERRMVGRLIFYREDGRVWVWWRRTNRSSKGTVRIPDISINQPMRVGRMKEILSDACTCKWMANAMVPLRYILWCIHTLNSSRKATREHPDPKTPAERRWRR